MMPPRPNPEIWRRFTFWAFVFLAAAWLAPELWARLGGGGGEGQVLRRRQGAAGGLRIEVRRARWTEGNACEQPTHVETGLHWRDQEERSVQDC